MSETRTVTTVTIAGDDYTIRSDASREHTLECARYVDETIREVMARGSLVEAHKAGILAALALADQLLRAREAGEDLRSELTRRIALLVEEIELKAPASGLAEPD